jgi:hypothetical protein
LIPVIGHEKEIVGLGAMISQSLLLMRLNELTCIHKCLVILEPFLTDPLGVDTYREASEFL